MNPYYRPWQSDAFYYTQSHHPYNSYPVRNYNSPYPYGMGVGNPTYGFGQGMYAYTNPAPYPYGYGYPAYTESVNTTGSTFNTPNLMSYFQDENGQIDFDKMMSTTGQVIKTVQQVSPIVKGIGTFVKGMK